MEESAKPIAPPYAAALVLVGERQTGGRGWWVQLERPMRAMGVVVLDVHPEHLLQVPAARDEQPVQALGADGTNPPLGVGVGVGRLYRRDQHLGSLRAEHVVEPTAELGVTIANKEAHPGSSFFQDKQEVACLLGNPRAVGVGVTPAR
jgi:hypothetical protein